MKYPLLLILGCTPLAALTAWSFIELGSIEDRPRAASLDEGLRGSAAAAEKIGRQAADEKPMVEGLAEVELLAADPIPATSKVAASSSLRPVADAWSDWTQVRALVVQLLETERQTAGAGPEEIDVAVRRLETLKEKSRASLAVGSEPLVQLLERRIADLGRQRKQREQQAEAESLIADARGAFHNQQHDQCARLCREVVVRYAASLDASTLEKVKLLGDRAAFFADHQQLAAMLGKTRGVAEQKRLLAGFLRKYGRDALRSSSEQQILQQRQQELAAIDARLVDEDRTRQAAAAVAQLDRRLPKDLNARLKQAGQLAARYPGDEVRELLAARIADWLDEFLPEKKLQEPLLLQEAETRRHEIVRGFFKTVKSADGQITGYKRYQTYEELLRPQAEVGTFGVEELLGAPGATLPRRLATRYDEARRQLRLRLAEKAAWTEFAETCERLETELLQYRRKPASSREPLSFQREGRLARETLAGGGVDELTRIMGR